MKDTAFVNWKITAGDYLYTPNYINAAMSSDGYESYMVAVSNKTEEAVAFLGYSKSMRMWFLNIDINRNNFPKYSLWLPKVKGINKLEKAVDCANQLLNMLLPNNI